MARITVKLDIGDGKLKSLASQLRRLNRQLDHLYTQGRDNNNTISNSSLTNFQNNLGAFNQATSQKKQESAKYQLERHMARTLMHQLSLRCRMPLSKG